MEYNCDLNFQVKADKFENQKEGEEKTSSKHTNTQGNKIEAKQQTYQQYGEIYSMLEDGVDDNFQINYHSTRSNSNKMNSELSGLIEFGIVCLRFNCRKRVAYR